MRAIRLGIAAGAMLAMLATVAVAQPRVTLQARRDIAPPAGVAVKDFGGLSGIDYDPTLKRYVAISDDTSQHGPARFYEAKIALGSARMTVTATRTLINDHGAPYPVRGSGGEQADGESIRVDPATGYRLWSSEGDINAGYPPALRWADPDGGYRGRFPFPAPMLAGVRHNTAYEGVTFTPDGDLWVGLEGPATQDGPLTTPQAGALTRLTLLDRFGAIERQVAYPLDPIWEATPGKNGDSGLSEILWLDDQHLLVLERAGVQIEGTNYGFHCRLYLADLAHAQDVTDIPTLKGADLMLVKKTLLVDFDHVAGGKVGNMEGMAWAPRGRFGPRRLVFVNDNNFDRKWASELLVFKFRP
jgi:hypothetical protein